MTLLELTKEQKNLNRRLRYYTKRFETDKISFTDYQIEIRPITYALKWVATLQKIEGLYMDIKSIRRSARDFLKLGTAENFVIRKAHGEIDNSLDFEELFQENKVLYNDAGKRLKKCVKQIYTSDLLDDILEEEDGEELEYE